MIIGVWLGFMAQIPLRYSSEVDAGADGRIATMALVTMANGGDNFGIYAPSFAIRSRDEIAVIVLVFVAMIVFWCFSAHSMVNHPKLTGLGQS
jgi:cadmium resistance protein CadD (predicted permease)